jgi:hypothetical protein
VQVLLLELEQGPPQVHRLLFGESARLSAAQEADHVCQDSVAFGAFLKKGLAIVELLYINVVVPANGDAQEGRQHFRSLV